MIASCRSAPYVDRIQLIIRHLHQLFKAWYKCSTILSSAGIGAIFKLKLKGYLFQDKEIIPVSFNMNVVKTLKPVFISLVMMSL
jgi:hypothetical protein